MKKFNLKFGFTLVELMIVMAVIAILVTMAFFGLSKAQASARDVQRQQTMSAIRAALERYYGDSKVYPTASGVAGSATNWSVFLTNLGASYIAAPNDPCGGGAGTAIPATGVMGTCTPAAYAYTQSATSNYTLTLTKESGGVSTFTNPL